MSDGQKDLNKEAVDGLAADIATKGSPVQRAALEAKAREQGLLKKGESFSSETAHRMAADAARREDARKR